MAANRPSVYDNQFFNAGVPAAGFKLYTYESGTTTPKTTYTDQAGTIPNTNPITLDADGMCELWLGTGEYTLALYTGLIGSGGALVKTWDDVSGVASVGDITTLRADIASPTDATKGSGMGGHNATLNYAAATIGAVLNDACTNVKMFPWLAKLDGVTDDAPAINAAITWLSANGGGQLFVPIGKALLGSQVLLKPGVSIIGEQRGQFGTPSSYSTVFMRGFTGASATFYSPAAQTIAGCTFENFIIEGSKGGIGGSSTSGHGIELQLGNDNIFRRVIASRCPGDGFLIGQGAGTSFHNYFYNCYAFFNGGDGYNNKSDWTRCVDCWADGGKSGFNNSGGSFIFIDRFHAEEFEDAGIRLSGSNGISGASVTIRDPIIFARPYQTAWRSTGVWVQDGLAGNGTKVFNPKIVFQPSYAALGTQAAITLDSTVSDILLEDVYEAGFSTSISHGICNRLQITRGEYVDSFTITSSCGIIILDGPEFIGAVSIAALSITSDNSVGYGNGQAFAPSLMFGGAAVGITGGIAGKWVRVGKLNTLSMNVTLTNKGSSTGAVTIENLPAPPAVGFFDPFIVSANNVTGITDFPIYGQVNSVDGKIRLYSGSGTPLTSANFTNTTELYLTAQYQSN